MTTETFQTVDIALAKLLAGGTLAGNCEEATALRPLLMKAYNQAVLCPEKPVEIDGEKWNHAKYVDMLQRAIKFTYDICKMEAENEGPAFFATTSAPCPNHKCDCK